MNKEDQFFRTGETFSIHFNMKANCITRFLFIYLALQFLLTNSVLPTGPVSQKGKRKQKQSHTSDIEVTQRQFV